MDTLPSNLLEYPLALGFGILGFYVVKYFLKREDKKEEMRERKDVAHIDALKSIQVGVVELRRDQEENWKVTKELAVNIVKLSENLEKTSSTLSSLPCFSGEKNIK